MDIYSIIFILLSGGLLVLSLYFFIRKIMLTNINKMSENNFVMSSRIVDSVIILIAEIVFFAIVIALNITNTLNVAYNFMFLTILVLLAVCQIIICRKKFVIKNNEIKVFPLVGKTKKFSFSDIDTIQEFTSTKGIVIFSVFCGKCEMLAFSDRYIGSNLFITRARKYCIKIIIVE